MILGDILRLAGKRALREVPLGGLVVDVVGLVADEVFDRDTVTGEQVEQSLSKLSPEKRKELMTKQFDSELSIFETVNQMKAKIEEKGESPIIGKVGLVVVSLMCCLSLTLLAIVGHAYITQGIMPTMDMVTLILGIPGFALATYAGIDMPQLRKFLVNALIKQAVSSKK